MAEYELSCSLAGHSLDVRGVAVCNDGSIISGSRDATSRLWKPNGINPGYHEVQTFRGHTNFVTCVTYCPPSDTYVNGLILTGSNDKNICGFVPEQDIPVFTLKGHTDTVCCLQPGLDLGTLLSSSWDKTARVWNWLKHTTEVTLDGHQFAVWCVIQLSPTLLITGSADKTIKMWSRSTGSCKSTLTGHSDCVRSLAKLSDFEFLSCANDASVRHWSATGDCLATLYGHANYIYCVAVLPSGKGFVSVGEDSSLRVWEDNKTVQTIAHPAQSVWCVCVLPNGDIVTGASDGMVRIFSRSPERQASEDVRKCYEAEIDAMCRVSSQELGGVKISSLPGKEALYEPGRSDGQTKLVREGPNVMCYSWSAEKNEWTKIGDVTGAAGGTQATSGKVLHSGKEYDFVFSIDIKDGEPPLKLPYNLAEDPWHVAQKFIHDNDLPQVYLEEIANFIIRNSKTENQAAVPVASQHSDFVDPFTGGNRYIPGGSQPTANSAPVPEVDPFTGGSRYVPSGAQPVPNNATVPAHDPFTGGNRYVPSGTTSSISLSSAENMSKQHFPQKTYLRFDQANLKAILEKLLEFNRKTGDGAHHVEESYLEGLVKMADQQGSPDLAHLSILQKLLKWPHDIVFPVLDITRLVIRHQDVNQTLCEGSAGDELFSALLSFLQPSPGPNQMLALRILSNMFAHSPGEGLVSRNAEFILQQLQQYKPPFTKPLEVAVATLLLNFSVFLTQKSKNSNNIDATGNVCLNLLPNLSDKEALYRGLVAVGTLLTLKTEALPKWAESLVPFIVSMTDSEDARIKSCAEQIIDRAS